MYSGQNYQVAVRTSAPSYLYVYQIGPKGDLYKLFPGKDYIAPGNKIANPLKGGKIYWLPAKDRWLRQDNQVGKEKIYVVAARSRNAILEDLYTHLEKIRARGGTTASSKKVQGEMEDYLDRLMAPTKDIVRKVAHPRSGVVPGDKIRSFEMLARIFQAPGLDAVKSVWFWHKTR
jgi:hypothetical protein